MEHVEVVVVVKLYTECQFGEAVAGLTKDVAEPFPLTLADRKDYVKGLSPCAGFEVVGMTRYPGKARGVSTVEACLQFWSERPRLTAVCQQAHDCRLINANLQILRNVR